MLFYNPFLNFNEINEIVTKLILIFCHYASSSSPPSRKWLLHMRTGSQPILTLRWTDFQASLWFSFKENNPLCIRACDRIRVFMEKVVFIRHNYSSLHSHDHTFTELYIGIERMWKTIRELQIAWIIHIDFFQKFTVNLSILKDYWC